MSILCYGRNKIKLKKKELQDVILEFRGEKIEKSHNPEFYFLISELLVYISQFFYILQFYSKLKKVVLCND